MSEADEIRAAIAANEAFYRAFAAGDAGAMDSLWATTTPVLCVHPGEPPLHGRAEVLERWRAILAAPPSIRASEVRVAVIRGVALVTCLELIEASVLCATNVFVWEDARWRLVHHHAGPVQRVVVAGAPRGPLH